MKYRKRPLEIEAVPVDVVMGAAQDGYWRAMPEWVMVAYRRGDILVNGNSLFVRTREGTVSGNRGDWLLKGVVGEIYPVRNEVFVLSYDPVNHS